MSSDMTDHKTSNKPIAETTAPVVSAAAPAAATTAANWKTATSIQAISLNALYGPYTSYRRVDGKNESAQETADRNAMLINYLYKAMCTSDERFTIFGLQEVDSSILGLADPPLPTDSIALRMLRKSVFWSYAPRVFTGDYKKRDRVKGQHKGDGCAIVARKDRFDEKKSTFEALSLPEKFVDGVQTYDEPRAAILHNLHPSATNPSQNTVTVVSMHLHGPPGDSDVREQQFRYIIDKVGASKSTSIMLMGDYNEHDPARMKVMDTIAKGTASGALVRLSVEHGDFDLNAKKEPVFTCVGGTLTHIYVSEPMARFFCALVDIPCHVLRRTHNAPEHVMTPEKAAALAESEVYRRLCYTVPYGTPNMLLWPSDHFPVCVSTRPFGWTEETARAVYPPDMTAAAALECPYCRSTKATTDDIMKN